MLLPPLRCAEITDLILWAAKRELILDHLDHCLDPAHADALEADEFRKIARHL